MGRDQPDARRAVFLDRDGVINRNVFNPATGELEAPLKPASFEFIPGALEALRAIQNAGFLLFLVSNQPNYAKGKSTLEDLSAIHERLVGGLALYRVEFANFYYCFHHPNGNRYSRVCACRKPSPYFLFEARDEFSLDLSRCWMIGDRLTDIECGNRAGAKTIFIARENTCSLAGHEPDAVAPDLFAAAGMILAANPR
jgi:D-glycero-D-manno-heptose 1,7-bisphosphate phosphatase